VTKPHIRKQSGFWWCDEDSDDPEFKIGVGANPDGAYRNMIAKNPRGWWDRVVTLFRFAPRNGSWIP
jgi:hypothetical protein